MSNLFTDEVRTRYFKLFNTCQPTKDCEGTIEKILDNKDRYKEVASNTGVPWYVIALIHVMESSSNFSRHLHNGDPLTARTVHVPANRPSHGDPPFTWEESAGDAIRMKLPYNDWSLEGVLYFLEKYNGWGYQYRNVNSPYLWGNSNHHSKGKFVKDGKYDPNAKTSQIGAAVLLKELYKKYEIEIESSVKQNWGDDPSFDNNITEVDKKKESEDQPSDGFNDYIHQLQKIFKIFVKKL